MKNVMLYYLGIMLLLCPLNPHAQTIDLLQHGVSMNQFARPN